MGTTVVDTCNIALGMLGDRANVTSIDPPEGSAQADHCARFYPIARDEVLEETDWTFASVYETLAELPAETNVLWLFVYALPAQCMVVREVVYTDGTTVVFDPDNPQFEMGSLASGQLVLYTNAEAATLRYTKRVVDLTKWSTKATSALQYLLASYLAGPVIKGKTGAQASQTMRAAYMALVGRAAATDANQNSRKPRFIPSSMRVRGYGGRDTIVEVGQERRSLPFWAA